MKTKTFACQVNLPAVTDFGNSYPQYGRFAREEGKFLFELIVSPESFVRALVATVDLELPALAGIAKGCYQAVQAQNEIEWNGYVKQFIGATVCALMEANGFRKTQRKRAVPHPAFSKAEVYGFANEDSASE